MRLERLRGRITKGEMGAVRQLGSRLRPSQGFIRAFTRRPGPPARSTYIATRPFLAVYAHSRNVLARAHYPNLPTPSGARPNKSRLLYVVRSLYARTQGRWN
jgi:hypothetical protein